MNSLYEMRPSTVSEAVEACLIARLVPFIQSSPGCGKSSIVRQIAERNNLKLIDIRLSSLEPCDLQGLPFFQNGRAKFHPYEMFPLEDSPLPEGKDGWLLFLDEFNSASRAVQAASYRLVLDHEVGGHKLHERCVIACAGNKSSDNAIVNKLSTALLSRVVHINMEVNFEDWLNNVAIPEQYDERIIAFLNMYPEKLMVFDPEKDDQTFACPRTWEFANKLIKDKELKGYLPILLGGAINPDIASEFVQFAKVFKKLIRLEEIVRKDGNCPVPEDTATKWAIISYLMYKTEEKQLPAVLKYVDNFDSSFKLLIHKIFLNRFPGIYDKYNHYFRENMKYLLGS